MEPLTGKPTQFIRLAICSDCNLRCGYCFVRKTGQVMTYPTARRAVKLLLNSAGNDKVMTIYGGEPLLHFELIKKTVLFARKKAAALKKELVLSLGTNGVLLNETHLKFLKKNGVKLLLSLDGGKELHDRFRTSGRAGSYDKVLSRLPLVLKYIKKEDLSAQLVVLPSTAQDLRGSLQHLYGLGFDNLYIQIVFSPEFPWGKEQLRAFTKNLSCIMARIYGFIGKGRFLFLNTVNMTLAGKGPDSPDCACPFRGSLEIYPRGEFGFSPFLMNAEDNDKYLVGDVWHGLRGKYKSCRHVPGSAACSSCWQAYLSGALNLPGALAALKLCDAASVRLAGKISVQAGRNAFFKRYLREAKKRTYQ